jgi:hypothetical protein
MNKEQFEDYIDVLAKNAANQNHIDYTDEYWYDMEVLLDKNKKKKRIFFWWLFSILFLLICGYSLVFITQQNQTKQNKLVNNTIISDGNEITNKKDTFFNNYTLPNSNKNVNHSKKISKQNLKQTNKSNSTSVIHSNDFRHNKVLQKAIITKTKANKRTSSDLFKEEEKKYSYIIGNERNNHTQQLMENNKNLLSNYYSNDINAEETNYLKLSKIQLAKIHYSSLNNYFQKTIDTLYQTKSMKNNSENKPLNNKKSFIQNVSFDLLLASDLTTDGVNNKQQLSNAFGILVTYAFSKKVSVTTGFAVAKKLYSADTNTYKNTYSLGNHYLITDINATCMVYEIPFQVNYLIKNKGKNSFLVSAGLSSYLMQKEDYIYTYDYYGYNIKYPYRFKNENNHFFSVLSVSPIFRRKLNNKFAIQIMPYAKIPLTGIGNGKVKLYSFGLGVLFNYNAFKR